MFDVYVKGINPERIDELEDIKKKIVVALAGEQDLERLLYPKGGSICIQKNISEADAKQTSKLLADLGLLCTYKPHQRAQRLKFTLVPLEKAEAFFTCPACQKRQALHGKAEPKFCPLCNVYINKFREEQQEKAEHDDMRQKILRLSRNQLDYEKQENRKEAERKRKALLEEQVAKELGMQSSSAWKPYFGLINQIQKRYQLTALVFISLMGGAIYEYNPTQSAGHDSLAINIPETLTRLTPRQPRDTIVIIEKQLPTLNDMADSQTSGVFVQNSLTLAQGTSAQNHAYLLNAMKAAGLNTRNQATKNSPVTVGENRLFLDTIYGEIASDVEWDVYINRKAKDYIKSGNLKSAYQLSQQQSDLTDHIGIISELLAAFSSLERTDLIESATVTLTQRIDEQPQELQAIYKVQLAIALQGIGKQNNLLNEAEHLALSLKNPIKQSQALSGIAVYQKSAGQPETANKFLLLAEEKLRAASPGKQKFSAYLNLAHDYAKLGFTVNAELALTQAENLLAYTNKTNQEHSLAMLLNIAYLSNNGVLSEKYASRIKNSAYRSNASYQNIQSRLKDSRSDDVAEQLAGIADPEYAAVTTALSTFLEIDPARQSSLTSTAQLKLTSIQDNEKKAVATSKVARYFYRLGDEKSALILFDQAFSSAKTIDNTDRKDAVLIVLAMDYAKVFLTGDAERMANLIQAKNARAATFDMIKTIEPVKSIINS
jgi:rubrerythrin